VPCSPFTRHPRTIFQLPKLVVQFDVPFESNRGAFSGSPSRQPVPRANGNPSTRQNAEKPTTAGRREENVKSERTVSDVGRRGKTTKFRGKTRIVETSAIKALFFFNATFAVRREPINAYITVGRGRKSPPEFLSRQTFPLPSIPKSRETNISTRVSDGVFRNSPTGKYGSVSFYRLTDRFGRAFIYAGGPGAG